MPAIGIRKAYFLCTFHRNVIRIVECLSIYTLNQICMLSGVIIISYVLFMCYRAKWLANLGWIGRWDTFATILE